MNLNFLKRYLSEYTVIIEEIPSQRVWVYIFFSSALSLYFELMIIRLHSSFFQLFAYYKNLSLLSCFLGLGIGFGLNPKRKNWAPLIMPLFSIQIIFLYILKLSKYKETFQNPVSEQLTMGLANVKSIETFFIVILFLVIVFVFNTLCFIPIGQLVSKFMAKTEKLKSYNWNLLGSILGIIIFSFISYLWAPPILWCILGTSGLILFLYKKAKYLLPTILSLVILIVIFQFPLNLDKYDIYSPYQVLTLTFRKNLYPEIKVNNVYFQHIIDFSKSFSSRAEVFGHYSLPYLFKKKPKEVLIIGSGAGNDVASALYHNAGSIDAVEIDPVILKIGKTFHPNSPYNDKRVKIVINDARAFFQTTEKKYDLIVYGLLDSHTLLSGMGSIRLDSYVYTVESFKIAKSKLKKDGVISLSFYVLTPALAKKLYIMLQEAFNGKSPVVYRIGESKRFTFLIGENLKIPSLPKIKNLKDISKEIENGKIKVDKSTDNWPFFYMPVRKYPISYIIILSIIFLISNILIYFFLAKDRRSFSLPCFFLGIGFMLLETKAITELAVVFGTTWIVNSIVFLAIIFLTFLANLLVIKKISPNKILSYAMLLFAIIIGLIFSKIQFNFFIPQLRYILMPIILTLPLFFSGFAFSKEILNADSVSSAIYSNLLGAMLGGILEYNSMYFGFSFLYVLAIVVYVLALISSLLN